MNKWESVVSLLADSAELAGIVAQGPAGAMQRISTLALVDADILSPDPDARLGAYLATHGYSRGTVGCAVHHAIVSSPTSIRSGSSYYCGGPPLPLGQQLLQGALEHLEIEVIVDMGNVAFGVEDDVEDDVEKE